MAVVDVIDRHIDAASSIDPEDIEARRDWIERGKTVLRVVDAAQELQERFDALPWEFNPIVYFYGQDTSDWPARSVQIRKNSMTEATRILTAAADEYRLRSPLSAAGNDVSNPEDVADEIFIVYGHDHAFRGEVEMFLAAITGKQPIVFDKEPSHGSETVIEKLERLGARAGFAVVLMTADDIAEGAGGIEERRARQNVLIELGWFAGRLGRSRVRIVRQSEASMPSDLGGILYTASEGNWQTELAKDLKAAGLRVDMNNLL